MKLFVRTVCVRDACVSLTYPPEVFSVGLFGDVVFGVYIPLQGAEASTLGNVLFAEHACHLEDRTNTSINNLITQLTSAYFVIINDNST